MNKNSGSSIVYLAKSQTSFVFSLSLIYCFHKKRDLRNGDKICVKVHILQDQYNQYAVMQVEIFFMAYKSTKQLDMKSTHQFVELEPKQGLVFKIWYIR